MNRRGFLQSGLLGLVTALHAGNARPAAVRRHWTIKVLGIGGAGVGVVDELVETPTERAVYGCIETDWASLARSQASHRYLPEQVDGIYGPSRMASIREMAWRHRDFLGEAFEGADYALLVGGLAGGTGGGMMPVVAEIASASGTTPIIIGILPFPFEGLGRWRLAESNATLLQERYGSAFTPVDNEPLMRQLPRNSSLRALFQASSRHVAAIARTRLERLNADLERLAKI